MEHSSGISDGGERAWFFASDPTRNVIPILFLFMPARACGRMPLRVAKI